MATEAEHTEEHAEEEHMRLPLVAAFGATRALGGFGLGLLLANKFGSDVRRKLGMALLGGGIASTIPLIMHLRGHMHHHHHHHHGASAQQPA